MTATTTTSDPAGPAARPSRSLWRLYLWESRAEFLKLCRLPAFAIPTIAFPAMFYLLFGIAFNRGEVQGVSMSTYLLATYGTFGVIGAALFGFGVAVAIERGQGWMLLKRASPMPVSAYFFAKEAMALLFATIIVVILFLLGLTLGDVPAAPWMLLQLGGVLLISTVPFAAFGLCLGYLAGPNSAPAVANLLYLPMAFASGLWIPIGFLPDFVQTIALGLPAYHAAQLALETVGASEGQGVLVHLGYLALFTAAALVVAAWAYRRDEDRTFG